MTLDECEKSLTPAESEFIESWPGHVAIIENVPDALAVLGIPIIEVTELQTHANRRSDTLNSKETQ